MPALLTESFTVQDCAKMLGFSERTIIRVFSKEPGVIMLERPETKHKRRYRSLRIPREVFERVIKRGRL